MSEGLFDVGLQPERTELAWRRTALSLGVGSLVSVRLLPAVFGDVAWVVPGLLGVVVASKQPRYHPRHVAGLVWAAARRRYVAFTSELLGRTASGLPGGALLLALCAVAVLAGGVGAAVILFVALRH
jgi:hypothetical protein